MSERVSTVTQPGRDQSTGDWLRQVSNRLSDLADVIAADEEADE